MVNPIRVVAVDDDTSMLVIFEGVLKGLPDIELVATGRNGREAIQLVNSLRPDVLFLDINMPVLNGLEAAARVSTLFPQTAIAILTGEQSKEFLREALRTGVREYLDKPSLRPAELPGIIRRMCEARAAARAETPARGLGSVWTFYGPKGGAGATMQAINAGVELALLGYKVLLVDLDLEQGDVGFYLQPKWLVPTPRPQLKLLSRLGELSSIEEATVRRGLCSFRPPASAVPADTMKGEALQIDVLPSPNAILALDEEQVQTLGALLEFFTGLYDFVILDLAPGRIFERGMAVSLDFSEKFFLVANQDMSSMKATRLFSQVISDTPFSADRISVLLSSMLKHGGFDAKAWLSENKVPVHDILEIPLDVATAQKATLTGTPFTLGARNTALAAFSRRVVEHALNQEPATGRSPSLWERFQQGLVHVFGP